MEYREGLDVGYRAWERNGLRPAAPFGHGLGWTTWDHIAARLLSTGRDRQRGVEVEVTIRNTGRRAGREVVQIYVEPLDPSADVARPVRWLGGFAVADVPAGDERVVTVRIPVRAFQVWDVAAHRWTRSSDGHRLRIGRSVRDLRLTVELPDPALPSPPSHDPPTTPPE